MKLNIEEQTFVHRWALDYVSALKCARAYRDNLHREYKPKMEVDEITGELDKSMLLYADYRFWYGVLLGLIHGMSYKVRLEIYSSCYRALQYLTEEAYGQHEKDY